MTGPGSPPSGIITTSAPAGLFARLSDEVVRVFSLQERRQVCELKLAERATAAASALVPGERPLFITAAWREEGITAFEVMTGERVWQRKDLNRTAQLAFLGGEPGKPTIGTAREDGLGWALNALTGKPVAALRTIRQLFAEPARSRFVTVTRAEWTFRDASTWSALSRPPLFKQTGQSLQLLGAAISDELVVISRPGGDYGGARLEAFTHTGAKRWNCAAPEGSQFVQVAPGESGFMALESGAAAHVVEVDEEGKVVARRPLPPGDHALFDEGRLLVTQDAVRSTRTLEVVLQL